LDANAMSDELEPENASVAERQAREHAAAGGVPFLVFRDGEQRQRIHVLRPGRPVTVGRTPEADVQVSWDERVSRLHARLELVGDDPASDWTVVDDAPSRNGTFLNGQRVRGRARLRDGDRLTFADTAMLFSAAPAGGSDTLVAANPLVSTGGDAGLDSPTIVSGPALTRASLSDVERRVLSALAKPVRSSAGKSPPATDEQIARETYLSADTIQRTIAGLCARLGLEALSEEEQRLLLVAHAVRSGVLAHDRDGT
jgi:pSer/pThr/pTyr-binding forkhead associated (FHA) protein